MTFTRHDARWLSATLGALYEARTPEELHTKVIPLVHEKFRSTISAFESSNHDGSQFISHRVAGKVTVPPDYFDYLWDSPNVIRLLAGGRHTSLHLREHTSRAQLERTEYFNALAKMNRLNDQLMTVVWHQGRIVNLGINRDRVFSAEERTMLQWLQPHLAVALRRVGAGSDHWPAGYGNAWIGLSGSLHPTDLTRPQSMVLKSYFPGWRCDRQPWPPQFHTWLEAAARSAPDWTTGKKIRALRVESSRGELVVRYYPATAERGAAVRLIEWAGSPSYLLLRSAGLTSRECEVLHWIAQGKRDTEIAAIIACTPATVGKHVENLLRKLHAENRGAAVSTARALLCGR